MAKGIQLAFVGPMSPKQFISEFFPPEAPKEVSSAFEAGLFDEVSSAFETGLFDEVALEKKKEMYDPFVRTISPYLVART